MFRQILMIVLALVIQHHSELPSCAQIKPPADPPKPPESEKVQESFKVLIEEVRIPISATDANGRFDPTVSLRDLMVKEDRVVQQLNSVYRIPANVSQYVISYKPLRPLSSVNATEYRKLEVMSRRVGLNIKARRGYVASAVRQTAP